MSRERRADRNWLLDNRKVLAVGLLLFVAGMVLILVSGHAMETYNKVWKDIVEYLGKALLVGAVVEFVFAVVLVDDVLDRIRADIGRLLPTAQLFSKAGVEDVVSEFRIDDFVAEIRDVRGKLDVNVMQSQVFEVDHFAKILEAAAESPAKSKTIRLLLGNPASPHVVGRYREINSNMPRDGASEQMRVHLEELLHRAATDPNMSSLIASNSLQVRLLDCRLSLSVYRHGHRWWVGWFPKLGWCIRAPHIICCHPIIGGRTKPGHTIGGIAEREFETTWVNSEPIQFNPDGTWSIPKCRAIIETKPSGASVPEDPNIDKTPMSDASRERGE